MSQQILEVINGEELELIRVEVPKTKNHEEILPHLNKLIIKVKNSTFKQACQETLDNQLFTPDYSADEHTLLQLMLNCRLNYELPTHRDLEGVWPSIVLGLSQIDENDDNPKIKLHAAIRKSLIKLEEQLKNKEYDQVNYNIHRLLFDFFYKVIYTIQPE